MCADARDTRAPGACTGGSMRRLTCLSLRRRRRRSSFTTLLAKFEQKQQQHNAQAARVDLI